MLRNSYPQNRINDIAEFSFCTASGLVDGTENGVNRRNGYIGWWNVSGHYADAGLNVTFTRFDDEGVQTDLKYEFDSGVGSVWIFGYFHIVQVSTFDSSAIQFIGWKTNEELYIPTNVAGYRMDLDLDGSALDVSNALADALPVFFVGVSHFVMLQSYPDYSVTVVVPKLGGATAADDYTITGDFGVVLADSADLGANWQLTLEDALTINSDGVIHITSTPPPSIGTVQTNNGADNGTPSITGVAFDTIALVPSSGDPFPIDIGEANNSPFATGTHAVDVQCNGSCVGALVTVTGSDGILQSQPFTGAGVYNFTGVVLDAITTAVVSIQMV